MEEQHKTKLDNLDCNTIHYSSSKYNTGDYISDIA